MKLFTKFLLAIFCFWNFGAFAAAEVAFSDVEKSRYKESILELANAGIIKGYENGEYRPFKAVNRAEFLKMVLGALYEEDLEYEGGCFPDVSDEWFAPYVCKAKDLGVVAGYPDGFFRPGQEVNMVEAFKIATEAFDLPMPLEENADWTAPYVAFMHNNNIFSKYSYLKGKAMWREQVAFLISEMLDIRSEEQPLSDTRNSMSAGCSLEPPAAAPSSFLLDGVTRSAITVIPAGYDKSKPMALVFAFHGRTNSNDQVRSYYRIEKPSNGQAIFVYPAAIQKASGYTWSDGGDAPDDLRDYALFDVMLEEISATYCVDLDKVYVVGHSLGAWFANSLACARGDVIRGAATLGGARSNSDCRGPVAAMQWHNPKDSLASFSSAVAARDWYLRQNQCGVETVAVAPFWGNCVQYQGCSEYSPMVWCPHTNDYDSRGQYYTHNWPKDAGGEMWSFFAGLPD